MTDTDKQTRLEGAEINQSLLAVSLARAVVLISINHLAYAVQLTLSMNPFAYSSIVFFVFLFTYIIGPILDDRLNEKLLKP